MKYLVNAVCDFGELYLQNQTFDEKFTITIILLMAETELQKKKKKKYALEELP